MTARMFFYVSVAISALLCSIVNYFSSPAEYSFYANLALGVIVVLVVLVLVAAFAPGCARATCRNSGNKEG